MADDLDDFPFDRVMLRSSCNHELLFKSIVEEVYKCNNGFYQVEDKIKEIINVYNKLGYQIEYDINSDSSDITFKADTFDVHTEYCFTNDSKYTVIKTYSQEKTWKKN